jgi:hypothetical protein
MDSGKIAWKNWLREIAPNPFNQASLENISSGADQLSNDIIETPLYCNKINCVNTEKMTLEITPDRVREISLLVEAWLGKKKSSLYELQYSGSNSLTNLCTGSQAHW